jgi:hypothetical protein
VTSEVLGRRALNRALLERRSLHPLEISTFDAIERFVGVQALVPTSPYVGLWTRLDSFGVEELYSLIVVAKTADPSPTESRAFLLGARLRRRQGSVHRPARSGESSSTNCKSPLVNKVQRPTTLPRSPAEYSG